MSGRAYRMAYLSAASDLGSARVQSMLFDALATMGYESGRNLAVERRFAHGAFERLQALAGELVAGKPDVLFATGTQAAVAAAQATRSVPIVFAAVSYPVAMGLVRTLESPGTNLTGLANQTDRLCRKRLELLREVFPRSARIAVIQNPHNAVEALMLAAMEEISERLRVSISLVEVSGAKDYDRALGELGGLRPDAVYVIESPLSFTLRDRIVESIAAQRLRAVYGLAEFAEAGGLMSYSYNLGSQVREAAGLVDRILRGAKPAALPVRVPDAYELVLNERAAEDQGVTFPAAVRARADRVIE